MSPSALVRGVPDSFVHAITSTGPAPIDVTLARSQHGDYVAALTGAGVDVTQVDADERTPDCPFVEDVAVILGEAAVVTRPGAVSRRGEVGPVAVALARAGFAMRRMDAPATLDGGDVLTLGDSVYIGLSQRTNAKGAEALARIAGEMGYEAITVDSGRALHLKSGINALGDDAVLIAPEWCDPGPFAGRRVVETAPGEQAAANVLSLADGAVLVPAGYPATRERLENAGYTTRAIAISEFAKADGGLTCLSLRW